MGSHQVKAGRDIIDALEKIGQILGYHSKREWPVPATGDRPQAIDICWFFDTVETSPLFAFEVESRDTAAAQGNANKLFAKPTSQLQKPLFFFHLFLDESSDSTRKNDLVALYGRYNYNVYSLPEGCLKEILSDILRQHRRLSDRLPLFKLSTLVNENPRWNVDAQGMHELVAELGFEHGRGTLLGTLGNLLANDIDVRAALKHELIRRLTNSHNDEHEQYDTWFGNYYQEPIHWAMLACLDPTWQRECTNAIISWQMNSTTNQLMIGPPFGRNREYDYFVLCFAPSMWALLAGLIGDSNEFRKFACEQIDRVAVAVEGSEWSKYLPYSGLWMLLIAVCGSDHEGKANRAREIIAQNGGVSASKWRNPPSVLHMKDGDDFPGDIEQRLNRKPLLDLGATNTALEKMIPAVPEGDRQAVALIAAITALARDEGMLHLGDQIAKLLPLRRSQA